MQRPRACPACRSSPGTLPAMRGIVLAGGTGTRLWPVTKAVSKQLLPVYDKPMIYYPLCTLVAAGIREFLLISSPEDQPAFRHLLGDGSQWGLEIQYAIQKRPEGIAQALLIGEDFVGDETVALILGDNIFHGTGLGRQLGQYRTTDVARIFAFPMADPSPYAVVDIDQTGKVLDIVEKPAKPKTRYAVPGLYFYDNRAIGFAHQVTPSGRGELEITAVNEMYMQAGDLYATVLERGTTWFDAGTFQSLLDAAMLVQLTEERQGMNMGSVEEAAWQLGYIDDTQLWDLAQPLLKSGYGRYLVSLLDR